MVDELDVVAVRVEHERAVVARVVYGTLARGAVVLVAGESALPQLDRRPGGWRLQLALDPVGIALASP